MKKIAFLGTAFLGVFLLGACAGFHTDGQAPRYRVSTEREPSYYLGTDAEKVQDTCPGNDILTQYNCSKKQENGFVCFDVYMAQGSPAPQERYTLLSQKVEKQSVSPEPQCPAGMKPDCVSFLKEMKYNLEFSWYLANFPSSSFEQCRETYDCKRIDCFLPPNPTEENAQATLVSCVYKRNQVFFVGSDVTCRQTPR